MRAKLGEEVIFSCSSREMEGGGTWAGETEGLGGVTAWLIQ